MLEKLLSFGNRKLPTTTAIFNMNSATDCPSLKLGFCTMGKKCYAMKAERNYPQVLPYRRRQEEYWETHTAEEMADHFFETDWRKKGTLKALRVSEAGDFKSQNDVAKLSELATIIVDQGYDISTYVYTARRDLDFSDRGALQVLGTHFMVDAMFVPVKELPTFELPKKSYICNADCKLCSVCSYGQQSIIYNKIH